MLSSLLLLGALAECGAFAQANPKLVNILGAQGINLLRLSALDAHSHARRDQVPLTLQTTEFKPHWFEQPVDHFANDSETWQQRYWINTRHYKPGTHAPVIVIDGGETSGENRLPFLDTGIADILPKATGGIGVILEHRCVSFAAGQFNGTLEVDAHFRPGSWSRLLNTPARAARRHDRRENRGSTTIV